MSADKVDMVNHPPHYEGVIPGIECIDVVENMCYNRGAAVKYIWRAGHKYPEKEIEDLQKAVWYLNREIERLKKRQQKATKDGTIPWTAD